MVAPLASGHSSKTTSMFRKILVPTDGTPLAEKAVQEAIDYAKTSGGEIVALSIAPPYVHSLPDITFGAFRDKPLEENVTPIDAAQQIVDNVLHRARVAGVRCKTRIALSFDPYQEIVDAAEEFDCDVIFMATHGYKGLKKLVTGSETQRVLDHTTLPVLVLR